ncbi:MAG TPA: HAD family hydrolase [Anaerolineaceae bacterium]|nr:HAD family hydrolase [Anaerolineaceae bacterium]
MPKTSKTFQSSLDRSMVKALLFDIDGTLSDSDDEMVASIYARVAWLTPLFKKENLHRFVRKTVHFFQAPVNRFLAFLDHIGIDSHLARFLDYRASKKEALPEDFPIIPGVRSMLEALKGHYPFAVVSARNKVTVQKFLRVNDLEDYFQIVISSQTCEKTKPFADPLLHAAEELDVPIENCLMIGDTLTDVRAALAAGAQSLSVLCGFGTEKELQKSGTHHILQSTSELANYLNCELSTLDKKDA